MTLAVVRDLRDARAVAGPAELDAFETDVLAGFVHAPALLLVLAALGALAVLTGPLLQAPRHETRTVAFCGQFLLYAPLGCLLAGKRHPGTSWV